MFAQQFMENIYAIQEDSPQTFDDRPAGGFEGEKGYFDIGNWWLYIATDGPGFYFHDFRFQRAGWGLFVGDEHPWNKGLPVIGLSQTAQRGEVRALLEALRAPVLRVHVITDSDYCYHKIQKY